jgi:2-methylisocitrate lyase-like PEP mutase family enzyme
MTAADARTEFRRLHASGCFVMPNAPDVGSARLLQAIGAAATATTSSGFAATLGRRDMTVTRDELVAHVAAMAGALTMPVSVDAERCFADDAAGVAETVGLLAGAGAAGCSIEDWDPVAGRIDPADVAAERVAAAAVVAHEHGMVLTARCEHHIRGVDDFDATLARLAAYRDAGADALFAPGLRDLDRIGRVVELGAPVNVLVFAGSPPVAALADAGVRRISVGGGLTWTMYGALVDNARHLLEHGTLDSSLPVLDRALIERAFSGPA